MQKKKIDKQRNRDENMWEKYKEKFYTKSTKINLKNFEKTKKKKKKKNREKLKKFTFKWAFHSS